mgnify:CR=1 FL=1
MLNEKAGSAEEPTIYSKLNEVGMVLSRIESKLFPSSPDSTKESESQPFLSLIMSKLDNFAGRLGQIEAELCKL